MTNIPTEKRVLAVFIFQVIINWLYVLWGNAQPAIISSWVALSSLLGFIYFAFTILAAIGIYNKTRQGLLLGCAVIAFGMICAVISYNEAFRFNHLCEAIIVPLIILNTCVIIYLAFHQTIFTK